jgi:hypothetical protein
MRHKSYLTTKRYINMARQLDGAVEQLHVPEFLKTAGCHTPESEVREGNVECSWSVDRPEPVQSVAATVRKSNCDNTLDEHARQDSNLQPTD